MKTRRLFILGFILFAAAALAWLPVGLAPRDDALVAGRNVNMVSGTTLPGGDPWLQRQNEPSIAVSTRNPLHLLAGANDYRTVEMPDNYSLPGPPGSAPAGDAWLGVYMSYDGGESWTTTLVPGYPQDGTSSVLKGYRAAADPVVRAGIGGLFFYSGIAFDRDTTTGALSHGALFMSRYIDKNNVESSDQIQFLDTLPVDKSIYYGANRFIDKPWLAVDIPRDGGTVTIGGENVPAFNVYLAYTVFNTSGQDGLTSEIRFARSVDGGNSWFKNNVRLDGDMPGKGKKAIVGISQGAAIGIDPVEGTVYVAWRCFGNTKRSDAILIVKSTDGGATFSEPSLVADDIKPFDQGVSNLTFRTNTYPAIAVDGSGNVYIAWVERQGHNGSNIVLSTSTDGGKKWSHEKNIEGKAKGHQFMPSLAYAGGKLICAWYDQREDFTGQFTEYIEETHPKFRHTVDVRAALASLSKKPKFEESIQVSRYLFALDADGKVKQVQFNPPNLPMFKTGTQPFHGDYIDIAPSPAFVYDAGSWRFNTDSGASPVFHLAWTDNRDVRAPSTGNWEDYSPPGSFQPGFPTPSPCAGNNTGSRNQNIYTSRLTRGVTIGIPRNSKPIEWTGGDASVVPRAFAVFVRNETESNRCFRLTFDDIRKNAIPSFLEFETLDQIDVWVGANSSISRSVFIRSESSDASVTVRIDEIAVPGGKAAKDGYSGAVVINPDPSNPLPPGGDELAYKEYFTPNIINPNIINPAFITPNIINPNIINYQVLSPNIINPNIINPNIINPNIINPNIINPNIINFILNPNIINPNIINPNIINPNIINPNIINPNIINPNIINPNIINPNIINPNIINAGVADVVWDIQNDGNTASSYTLRTMSTASIPKGIETQLFVYRVHTTPIADGCSLKQEPHFELVVNITNPNIINPNIINPNIINPNIINPSLENSTFYLGEGENAIIDVRIIDPDPLTLKVMSDGQVFSVDEFAKKIHFAATAQPVESEEVKAGKKESEFVTSMLMIGTPQSLPDGVLWQDYGLVTLKASGAMGDMSWQLNSGDLPPGLFLDNSGQIYGKPTPVSGVSYPKTYKFIAEVGDGVSTDTEHFYITIYEPATTTALSIVTASLPDAVMDAFYGQTLEAVGGTWPRTWTLTSGSLPAGLTLDSAGTISGIPSAKEKSSFTVRVTDSSSPKQTAERAFSLTVADTSANADVTIEGTVYDGSGGTLADVLMRGLPDEPTTDSSGYYTATVPYGWSGTVTPFKFGYTFVATGTTDNHRDYLNLTAGVSGQDYNGTAAGPGPLASFLVEAPASATAGAPFSVTITAKDGSGNTTTNVTGVVSVTVDTHPENPKLMDASYFTDDGVDTTALTVLEPGLRTITATGFGGATGSDTITIILAADGSISGLVTTSGVPAIPIPNVTVNVNSPGGQFLKNATTDGSGMYTVSGVPAGDWKVYFEPPSANDYIPQWHNNQPDFDSAGQVHVTAGQTTANINAQLVLGGAVSGRVTSGTNGIENVRVFIDTAAGAVVRSSYTNSTGDYTVHGVPADSYKVYFVPPADSYYVNQWYDGVLYLSEAKLIEVDAGSTTTGINAQLALGGKISGTVVDDGTNLGIVGIGITLTETTTLKVFGTRTGEGGSYSVKALVGSYIVSFWSPAGMYYVGEFYDNHTDFDDGDDVSVTANNTTAGINARLIMGGAVQGTVTEASTGNPIPNVDVHVSDLSGNWIRSGKTVEGGIYTIYGIPVGDPICKVKFDPTAVGGYAVQWYDNASDPTFATAVSISLGAITQNIDAALAAGAATYTVTATMSGGTITPSGSVVVNHGADQAFSLTAEDGYVIDDVLVDGISVGAVSTYTFTNVTANHTIEGQVAEAFHTIDASAGAGGTIDPSGNVTVAHKTNQAFTITPAMGYSIADVVVDSVSQGALTSYTFSNVTANHTIAASFSQTVGPLDHFDIGQSPIFSPQYVDTNFSITITAKDAAGNVVTSYAGTNTLSTTVYPYDNISPTDTTSFVNGVWTGSVKIMVPAYGIAIRTTGEGKWGQSSAFDVIYPGALATVTGTVTFNGAPFITQGFSPPVSIDLSFFDYGVGGRYPVLPTSFDPATGTISIPNVRSGDYAFYLKTDATTPANYAPEPGDYWGGSIQFPVAAPTTKNQDFSVSRLIHLTAPVENVLPGIPRVPQDAPYPEYASPITFRWDEIPEAERYEIVIDVKRDSGGSYIEFLRVSVSGVFEKAVSLPASIGGENPEHYEFRIHAYNSSDVEVGSIQFPLRNSSNQYIGFRGSYIFKVIAGTVASFEAVNQGVSNETAGVSFNLIVRAKDQFGNIVESYEGEKAISSLSWNATNSPNNTSPTLPSVGTATFVDGIAEISGFVLVNAAEVPVIQVTIDGLTASTIPILVMAGPTFAMKICDSASPPLQEIGDRSLAVGQSLAMNSVYFDAFGNYRGSVMSNWGKTGTLDYPIPPNPAPNATYTPQAAGTGTITAVTTDGSGMSDATGTITVTAPTYTITATMSGGTITPSGSVVVNHGADQAFSLTAEDGYVIDDVLVDGISVGAVSTYTFTNVTANHTIEGQVAEAFHTIDASAGAGGTIDPSGNVTVAHKTNQAFTITPATGYSIADVVVDSVSQGALTSYTFSNVTANHTIAASFAPLVGPAFKLAFVQNPSGGVGGNTWATQPIVEVQDVLGNWVMSNNGSSISISILVNPSAGTLTGHNPKLTSSGRAAFTNLAIDKGGWGYTLQASCPGLESATSETFNIEGFRGAADLATPRGLHSATPFSGSLGKDFILIAGGKNGVLSQSSAQIYDVALNQFNPQIFMNRTRAGHTATPLFDGKILFAGGQGSGPGTAEFFNPGEKTFEATVISMNRNRYNHAAVLLPDGKVLLVGGTAAPFAEVFDPSDNSFTDVGNSIFGHAAKPSAILLPNGKVFVIGGGTNGSEIFDPVTGEFTLVSASLPDFDDLLNPISYQSAVLLNDGTVLITGGNSNIPSAAYVFNPDGNVFTKVGPMQAWHKYCQSVLLRDGNVLLVGGYQNAAKEIYDPVTRTFRATGPLVGSQAGCALAVLPDGRIFISGGDLNYGSSETTQTWIWNPLNVYNSHVIKGTIGNGGSGLSGVFLVGMPGIPMTDGAGYYEGVVLDGWDGTVFPTLPGATFDFGSTEYTDVTTDRTTNYEAVGFTLTTAVTPPATGTVSPSGTNTYPPQAVAAISATPIGPHIFLGWMGDATGTTNPVNVLMTRPKNVTAVFAQPLQVTTGTLSDGVNGSSYSKTLLASGGFAPYSWSLYSGSLPAGLSLSSGGVISGTPTATGTFNFTVRVRDSGTIRQTATRALSIRIFDPLTITTTDPLPTATVGVYYSVTIQTTGGTGSNTWSWGVPTPPMPGSLPPGLSLNPSTGVISGTPTSNPLCRFWVYVHDNANPQQTYQKLFILPIEESPDNDFDMIPLSISSNGSEASRIANFSETGNRIADLVAIKED